MVPPVFSAAKVEHEGLALWFILHQEGECGHVHGFMALLNRLHKGPGWYNDVGSGIYDVYVYTGVAFGKIERGRCLWFDVLI